jgi:Cu(I)/Ag(I) efflux system membrane fusion protein/cobalt-zinc-cadmium efflux system membrane fusion protein
MNRKVAFAAVFAAVVVGQLFHLESPSVSATAAIADDAPKQLWTCGMHPQVIQDHPGTCPICGMTLTPLKADAGRPKPAGERKVRYWWDPMMNPPYISDQPGKSPMGMDLEPVYDDQISSGSTIVIDPVVEQNMGVRLAPVTEGPLRARVRAVGYINEPESGRYDINLRVSGWIEKLYANVEGMHIDAGAPLFKLYSPELEVAIEELIAARRMASGHTGGVGANLVENARRKLELLGLPRPQVDKLGQLDRAPASVTFFSPMHAHLIERMVNAGAGVKAGDTILRLSDRSTMWLDLQIYEQDLPFVSPAAEVEATISAIPGRVFKGQISFTHPHVESLARTGMVRVVLANDDGALRQGMYASAEVRGTLAPRALLVPREAVIDTGSRQIAFVALERGHFEPRQVTLGVSAEHGMVQVLTGLAPGEQVVASGQFLLDAESRLREAIRKHLDSKQTATPAAAANHNDEATNGQLDH